VLLRAVGTSLRAIQHSSAPILHVHACMHAELCGAAHAGSWCGCVTHLSLSARHLDMQLLQPLLQPHLTHLSLRGGDLDRKDGCDARQLVDMLLQHCPRLEVLDLQVGSTVGFKHSLDSCNDICSGPLCCSQHTHRRRDRHTWPVVPSIRLQMAPLTAMSAFLLVCVDRTVICCT
jgi:hypothetical protein